jgi:hypothetical protein
MDNNETILKLLEQLGNQGKKSLSFLPWQEQMIGNAGVVVNPTLLEQAKSLSPVFMEGDVKEAKYFCFLPASRRKWKVFLVDRYRKVIARLEDYEGLVQNQTSAFLLEIN